MDPPQGPSACRAMMVDKFSALPSDLMNRILSPLPLADVTRVSCLSKRLREFHLSNPIVNLTAFPSECIGSYSKRLSILNSLDRFFILRGNYKIQSFSLHWICKCHVGELEFVSRYDDEKSRILSWIQNAVSRNVESLTVFFRASMVADFPRPDYLYYPFPCCVFNCESLRFLILDMRCAVLTASAFATSHVSNLVCLMLTNVTIEDDEGFCKWVSISCRSLKDLLLEYVKGLININIDRSSLESFSWNSQGSGSSSGSLKLNCPNLKHLKWVGWFLVKNLFMGEFKYLEEVEFSDGPFLGLSRYDFISASYHLFHSLRSVKALVLDQYAVKALFEEGSPPAPFLKLGRLHIRLHDSIDDNLVPALASLLKGAPNLNTLDISSKVPVINSGFHAFGIPKGYWEQQGLEFTSHLKEVTLELTNSSNGIGLAWHILEHAQNLKKMIIICFPILPHHSNFLNKLAEKSWITSKPTIIIQATKCCRKCKFKHRNYYGLVMVIIR